MAIILGIILIKEKERSDNKEKLYFFNKIKTLTNSSKISIFSILIFDNSIPTVFPKVLFYSIKTNWRINANCSYIYRYLFVMNRIKISVVLDFFAYIVVCMPIFLFVLFFNFINHYAYAAIASPTRQEIIIEHRDITLGETNHFYYFYRKTAFPGVMRKLNDETITIMTRRTDADNLEVLGMDDVEWVVNILFFILLHMPKRK